MEDFYIMTKNERDKYIVKRYIENQHNNNLIIQIYFNDKINFNKEK